MVGVDGTILRTTNGGGIIPVELVSFNAYQSEKGVILNWQTSTEINNNGFEVQRSEVRNQKSVGNQWEDIYFVKGNGTTTIFHSYAYTDNNITPGKYYYRLKQVDFDGSYKYSNEVEVNVAASKEFTLEQNYPNPFNPVTTIKYSIPDVGTSPASTSGGIMKFVQLKVYNALGEEIATLVNEKKPAGNYEVKFDGSKLPSGIYIYQLKAGEFIAAKKLIILK